MRRPIRTALKIAAALVLFVAAAFAGLFLYGPEQAWQRLAGPADLGPVDLATLARRPSPNDALLCSNSICPAAIADLQAGLYLIPAAELAEVLDRELAGETGLQRVDDGSDPLYRRFVQRSALMRFPDTIDVRVVPLAEDQSTLAIYSRAQLGFADFGVNLTRIRRWSAHADRLPEDD